MEFRDELPGPKSRGPRSPAMVDELKQQPGKWGNIYTQQEGEGKSGAYGRAQTFKNYAKKHNLPITVRSRTEDGVTKVWARWEG